MQLERKKDQVIFPVSASVGSPFNVVNLPAVGRREFSDDVEIFPGPGDVSFPVPHQGFQFFVIIL
nr:MAG TPA: hypothetical protein [Caudoviricetes sp.]